MTKVKFELDGRQVEAAATGVARHPGHAVGRDAISVDVSPGGDVRRKTALISQDPARLKAKRRLNDAAEGQPVPAIRIGVPIFGGGVELIGRQQFRGVLGGCQRVRPQHLPPVRQALIGSQFHRAIA